MEGLINDQRSTRGLRARVLTLAGLLSLAIALLIVALVLKRQGLQEAANVAQLVSIVLALPPLVAPLLGALRKKPDQEQLLHVEAEFRGLEVLARLADGSLHAVSGHSIRLYIETSSEQAVVLRRLHAIVVSRAPANGELVSNPSLGVLEPRPFALLLDTDPPTLSPQGNADFPFTVTRGDPEAVDVLVRVQEGLVQWYLCLDWSLEGQSGEVRIDASGQPFRTVGRAGLVRPNGSGP